LKTNFILRGIAEGEKIEVTPQELRERIRDEATRYNISPEKMRKELEEHNGIDGFAEQILLGKTLDFLKANVSVQPSVEPAISEQKS
jgi:trigger factor